MALVQFKQGTTSQLETAEYNEGVIYFSNEDGTIRYDLDNKKLFNHNAHISVKTTAEWDAIKNSYVPGNGELVVYADEDDNGVTHITDIKIGSGNPYLSDIGSIDISSFISEMFKSVVDETTLYLAL